MVQMPDIAGMSFGSWYVVRQNGSMPYGGAAWLCRCVCGAERTVSASVLRAGKSTSCGCVSAAKAAILSTTHGLTKHPLYRSWCRMKERCYYEKHVYFARYGGRGIVVCERWQTFPPFYQDNISRWQAGLSLDRIDNDGSYSLANTRWVPRAAQARNKRNTIRLTLNGTTLSLAEWAERLGISQNTLRLRHVNGWTDEHVLTTPHLQPHRL